MTVIGFDTTIGVDEQLAILNKSFGKEFSLTENQEKQIQKFPKDRKFLLVPFFEELVLDANKNKSHLYLRETVSTLYRKYKNEMQLDNNIRRKYGDGYKRTNNLISGITELWINQEYPISLLVVPFELCHEDGDPRTIYKKIFYQNIENQFHFGLYETIVAKIIFGNNEFYEDPIPTLCIGDELTDENPEVFSDMPSLEYDESGIAINSIPKSIPQEDKYFSVAYFKGNII